MTDREPKPVHLWLKCTKAWCGLRLTSQTCAWTAGQFYSLPEETRCPACHEAFMATIPLLALCDPLPGPEPADRPEAARADGHV